MPRDAAYRDTCAGCLSPVKRLFAVLSGLPASGKTTVARPLAAALSLPLLDKDGILESLFESLGVSTTEERSCLSRASDRVLQNVATTSQQGAVLSSFWYVKGQ